MSLAWSEILYAFENESEAIAKNPKQFASLIEDILHHAEYAEISRDDAHESDKKLLNTLELLQVMHKVSKEPVPQKAVDTIGEIVQINSPYFLNTAMVNQTWFLDKMKAVGYDLSEGGHCFGMTHMAMQAFLAGDIETFNDRLDLIHEGPIERFHNNFQKVRKKQQDLLNSGETEEAAELNQAIVDVSAFFDGIVLYQSTEKYKQLFEHPDDVHSQDAKKVLEITQPITLSENPATCLSSHTGSYDKNELELYLDLLQERLGEHSFALTLYSAQHAISLNYDAESGHWLLINPNKLPGDEYIHSNLLANALLSAYGQENGLVMETNLYATQKNAHVMNTALASMKNDSTWISLHDDAKLNIVYGDGMSQLEYGVARDDTSWVLENLSKDVIEPTKRALKLAVGQGNIAVIDSLVKYGATLTEQMLTMAVRKGSIPVIDSLVRHGVKPTEEMLTLALYQGSISVINSLVGHGVKPTDEMLSTAMYQGNIPVIDSLVGHGVKLTDKMLTMAVLEGSISVIDSLVGHGVKLTDKMLTLAVLEGSIPVIDSLVRHGVKPTEDMLNDAVYRGNIPVIDSLVGHGGTLANLMLRKAYHQGDVALFKALSSHVSLTETMLSQACKEGKVGMVQILIEHGVKPTNLMLRNAYHRGDIALFEVLSSHVSLTKTMLSQACKEGKVEVVQILVDKGVSLTDSMLINIVTDGNLDVINILINERVVLTEKVLATASQVSNPKIAQLMADRLIPDVMSKLGLTQELKKLGLSDQLITQGLATIRENVRASIPKRDFKEQPQTRLRDLILDKFNEHVLDKKSTLGSQVQHHKNPRLDKVFGITPKKFADYKSAFKELKNKSKHIEELVEKDEPRGPQAS